jgi:hypothetical protein
MGGVIKSASQRVGMCIGEVYIGRSILIKMLVKVHIAKAGYEDTCTLYRSLFLVWSKLSFKNVLIILVKSSQKSILIGRFDYIN